MKHINETKIVDSAIIVSVYEQLSNVQYCKCLLAWIMRYSLVFFRKQNENNDLKGPEIVIDFGEALGKVFMATVLHLTSAIMKKKLQKSGLRQIQLLYSCFKMLAH